MHIQMQHTSLWSCSPYLCASNFNWSPSFLLSYYIFVSLPLSLWITSIFVNYFSPFVIDDHKRWVQILDRLCETMLSEDHFPKFGSIKITCQKYLTRLDPRISFTPQSKGYLMPCWVKNTYSSFSRSNTRFTSPQTNHMLPLDHFKHRGNSGTIQASNSFDFHEWAYRTWGMTWCTKQVLSKGWMTCQPILPCFAWRRDMSYKWGCINTYLRNPICSIHS
jgi:hypothetical protein